MLERILDGEHWWQSGNGLAEELEARLASFHSALGAVAVTNGTHALELALRGLGVGPGDHVLVSALTFISTAAAASLVGAIPVPVDVDPETLGMDPADLERKLTDAAKAIVPVHLAGNPVDMSAIGKMAAGARIPLIEDCAQATGAEWEGQRVGGLGTLGTHSFHANKLLASGEGGAVTVGSNAELLQRLLLLSNCGRARGVMEPSHELIGSNYRMTEFQAGILIAQLESYDELWARRHAAGQALVTALTEEGLALPVRTAPGVTRAAWYNILFRLPPTMSRRMTRHEFAAALTAEGIPARPLHPAFHMTTAYRDQYTGGICPNAEQAGEDVVFLHHRVLLGGQSGVDDVLTAFRKIRHEVVR
ncbi:DegT/DnrJ/EryC1/StrS family aminotransferase [Streptomyces sp. OE57]|uniref:DegT/DnrJ/EryC1/StrS family aminotransferase n=1 Tax=Streptomyces lacaronensis TaxID=3379885 RepID=UPI0039B7567E